MKIYVCDRYWSYIDNAQIDAFISTAYHGLSVEDSSGNLKLTANSSSTHLVTQPDFRWIVSNNILPILDEYRIGYRECLVERSYNFSIRFGNFEHWERDDVGRKAAYPESFFRSISVPNRDPKIKKFEVLAKPAGIECNDSSPLKFLIQNGRLTSQTISLASDMFEHNALLTDSQLYLCREDLWSRISEFLPREIFLVTVLEY